MSRGMMPTRQGSFRLFRLAGIDVFLHWSWFLIIFWSFSNTYERYSSFVWYVFEYLGLFGIVLLHEFGHALACRSVGGKAELIVLWPFGGVAYVTPPQRPGALLWSIAAGPLVNLVLLPLSFVLLLLGDHFGFLSGDLRQLVFMVGVINLVLLIFNVLPIYPLDGGQILRAVLWFIFGRGPSLMIASVIGFVGVAAMLGLAAWLSDLWIAIVTLVIILPSCLQGFQQARMLQRLANAPRYADFTCPSCKAAPVAGNYWSCGKCRIAFDAFVTQSVCPQCGTHFALTYCPECGAAHPMSEWVVPHPNTSNTPPPGPPPIPPGA